MKIRTVLSEMSSFDSSTLAVACFFGGAFSSNYYKKIIGIIEVDIMTDKLSQHKSNNEMTKEICLVTSELDNNTNKILCVKDILVMLDQFDLEREVYCINDDFNKSAYNYGSEICCIIDANADPDLKEFKALYNKNNILEFVF